MRIETLKLQELVSKAMKGVGNNKLLPITSLMAIDVQDGECTITTTDATNYLFVTDIASADDFYVVCEVDTFSKLVARLTSEFTELTVVDDALKVVSGKGSYSIALPLDENGELIKFPNPIGDMGEKIGNFYHATVDTILNALKPSLALTNERPCYTGYYVGEDIIIATDVEQISALAEQTLSRPQLISPEMMNLLSVTDGDVAVYENAGKLTLVSYNCTVYGPALQGIDNFAVVPIKGLVSQSFDSMVKLPKSELLQILDRIALFIDVYDEGFITFQFTDDGLIISNKQSSGSDVVEYLSTTDFKCYEMNLNINMIRAHIKAQSGDSVSLWYGDSKSIKIEDGALTSVIALMQR